MERKITRPGQSCFQLSFLRVEPDQLADFAQARAAYLEKRKEYHRQTRLYASFFSFPKRKSRDVFIELTEWGTPEALEKAEREQGQWKETQAYTSTFQLLETHRMQPEEGSSFDAEKLLKAEQAVEFAIRRIKPSKRKIYPERRARFMQHIVSKKGYVFDQEFVSLDKDQNILLFAWDSRDSFERAGKQVRRSPRVMISLLRYFSLIRSGMFQVGQWVKD